MDLKTFVENTIIEILSGVKSAQEKNQYGTIAHMAGVNQIIDFDVAVTTVDGAEASGGLKVCGIGAQGKVSESSSTVSRIKFKIPVTLPCK